MSEKKLVKMFVTGLALDPQTQVPIVVLRDTEDKRYVPIWIGPSEATSIASALRGDPLIRPLSHDLLCMILGLSNIKVQHATITDLRDATYYATIEFVKGDEHIVYEVRPSDAVAIALRAKVPILVADHVIEEANTIAQIVVREQQERKARRTIIDDEIGSSIIDANSGGVDKKRWKEVLERLNPDDFRFRV